MAGGGKEISLSVEETNRLRAKIGLRPLRDRAAGEVASRSRGGLVPSEPSSYIPFLGKRTSTDQQPHVSSIAAAAVLGRDNDDQDDGDEANENETTGAWVERMRAREAASGEIGAGNEKRPLSVSFSRSASVPVDDGLAPAPGAHIRHSGLDVMDVGEETMLTFADTGVLDESGDGLNVQVAVLENVHEREEASAGEKLRLRDGSALAELQYDPTDDADFKRQSPDETAVILKKYDEKREEADYVLDGTGAMVQQGPSRFRSEVAARLKAARDGIGGASTQEVETGVAQPKADSDYFTKEEFAVLKKGKKKSTSKKRKKQRSGDKTETTSNFPGQERTRNLDASVLKAESDSDMDNEVEERARLVRLKALRDAAAQQEADEDDDDEADSELYESLARARRASSKLRHSGSNGVADPSTVVLNSLHVPKDNQTRYNEEGPTILTETEQFVRSIGVSLRDGGDDYTEKVSSGRPSAVSNVLEANGMTDSPSSGPKTGDMKAGVVSEEVTRTEVEPAIPMALPGLVQTDVSVAKPMSMAYTVARLRNLGELKRPKEQVGRVRDERREDWKNGGAGREVKLSYKDELGRELTPKEEFRMMSHKFHGKGPGQNKREAAMRRHSKAMELRQIDITESRALELLREETKNTQSAHVVISGAAAIQGLPTFGKTSGGGSLDASKNGSSAGPITTTSAGSGPSSEGGVEHAGKGALAGLEGPNPNKRLRSEGKVEFSLGKRARRH